MTNEDDRLNKGRALAARLFKGAPRSRPMGREMTGHTMAHLFGDVWQGEGLETEERSLITCAVLTAMGKDAELRLHIRGARNLGIERSKLEAMMNHVAHYAGWPNGVSALRTLDEVWEQMDAESPGSQA
ncbi:MAG: carboxymuconolactone decarboxylase family protein [Acidimicrobiales bacterium]